METEVWRLLSNALKQWRPLCGSSKMDFLRRKFAMDSRIHGMSE
jgi:hypothetical protein